MFRFAYLVPIVGGIRFLYVERIRIVLWFNLKAEEQGHRNPFKSRRLAVYGDAERVEPLSRIYSLSKYATCYVIS